MGIGVLIGFAFILALTLRDNARRTSLETTSETTAVGDRAFFPVSNLLQLPTELGRIAGKPLYVMSRDTIEVRDTHTVKVPAEMTTGHQVYQLSATATDGERRDAGGSKPGFLLKTAPNRFLRAQTDPPGR